MPRNIFVLDTNALISESRFLNTPNLATIFFSAGYLDYRVFVPKVVIDELVFIYERDTRFSALELEESLRTANRISRQLDVPLNAKMPTLEEDFLVQKYRWRLETELWGYHASLLDYPEVSHQDLVRKASLKSKPFKDNGSGYKDALIWYSFLSVIEDDPECRYWLVTKNHRDFADNTGRGFHYDLIRELVSRGFKSEQVGILDSIAKVVDEFFVPFMTRFRRFEELIQSEAILPAWLSDELYAAVEEALHVLTREGFPEDLGFSEDVYEILDFQLQRVETQDQPRVYMLGEERALLVVEVEASIQCKCVVSSDGPFSRFHEFEYDAFDPEIGTIDLGSKVSWKVSLTLASLDAELGPTVEESLAILA